MTLCYLFGISISVFIMRSVIKVKKLHKLITQNWNVQIDSCEDYRTTMYYVQMCVIFHSSVILVNYP